MISPQLFRHFAVVTVGITIVIGIMADGESREAVTDEFEQRAELNERKQIEHDKLGPQKLELRHDKNRYKARAFDGEGRAGGESYGAPMDGGGGGGGGYGGSSESSGRFAHQSANPYAVTEEEEAPSLSGTDGQAGTAAPQKKSAPPKPTPEQIAQTLAASRARSGGDSSDDNY